MPKSKWLFCRFGGIGDSMMLTAVARAIKDKWPDDTIDFAVKEVDKPIFDNLPVFRRVLPIRRFPDPMRGVNCVKVQHGWESLEKRKEQYDIPMDFINSIENNSMHPKITKFGEWMQSQNSNFANWCDISLGWAKLDPEKVKNKRPMYIVTPKERRWAKKLISAYPGTKIALNTFSSSLARSYFNVQELVQEIIEEYTGCTVFMWTGESWMVIRKGGSTEICKGATVRESAAIIEQMQCFVCADSGFSHIAEALGIESVSIYTTVPAWTRNKYYLHAHDIQIDIECGPCFTLHYQCPVNRARAFDLLSPREREILNLANQKIPIEVVSNQLNTTPDKLQQELNAVNQRLDGTASIVPDCIASITVDMIIDKINEALGIKEMV